MGSDSLAPKRRSETAARHGSLRDAMAQSFTGKACKAAALGALGLGGVVGMNAWMDAQSNPSGQLKQFWGQQATGFRLDGPAAALQAPPATPNALLPPYVSHVGCKEHADSPPCAAPILPDAPLRGYMAMCTMFRDDPDLPDWLIYHRRLGVEAFYLYDHNSSQPMRERLNSASLSRGDVRYQYINHFPNQTDMNPQRSVYADCLALGKHHPWMVFINVDEYLVPAAGHVYLPDYLRTFEGHCALTLGWRILGSSNHTRRPRGKLVENYTKCTPPHTVITHQTKLIANPQLVDDFVGRGSNQGPHLVYCHNGTEMVTEDFKPFSTTTRPTAVPMKTMAVYHYITKSRQEFVETRRARGTGDKRKLDFIEEIDQLATEDCFGARDLFRKLGRRGP